MTKLEITFLTILKAIATLIITVFGGAIGIAVGLLLFYNYIPIWKQYNIPPAPEKVASILYVDIKNTLNDPTTDIVYVRSNSGKVHFISVGEPHWHTLPSLPDGQISQLSLRDGYENSPLSAAKHRMCTCNPLNRAFLYIAGSKPLWTDYLDNLTMVSSSCFLISSKPHMFMSSIRRISDYHYT